MDYDALRTPQDDIVRDGAEFQAYLAPAELIDSGHPDIVAYAAAKAGQGDDRTRALRLYYAVRDDLRYDPYNTAMRPEAYRASTTLAARHGYCVNKAGLMAAVILAGAGVYGMLLWIFRIQGREELLAMLRRRGAREG